MLGINEVKISMAMSWTDFFLGWFESTGIANLTVGQVIMMLIGFSLIFLAIAREYEPLLLLPIGFGCVLVNLPLTGLMEPGEGILWFIYRYGILTEAFPVILFIGIGAMTDFGPLLERPRLLLFGAAGQFGIFFTLIVALQFFPLYEASSIAIIGAADGPSAIYVTSIFAPHMLGPITVAAYSYMALVPIIQIPVIKLLTSRKQRMVRMPYESKQIPKRTKVVFPIIVVLVTCLIAPLAAPLMGSLMLGNLLRESGVVERLSNSAQNELNNITTLLLGLTIGATMSANDIVQGEQIIVRSFLHPETLLIFVLGLIAFIMATAGGLMLGQLWYYLSKGKINPMIGACGISAFPMSARVVHRLGREEDPDNFLIGHSMAANTGGQIGSVTATGILLLLVPQLAALL
jgi:oxaloacetate decarboxylase beta subunit